jgi:hypothetical protein
LSDWFLLVTGTLKLAGVFVSLIQSTTLRHHQSTAEKNVPLKFLLAKAARDRLGTAFSLSDTRLEFRSFGAVKHSTDALHFPNYPATHPLPPHPHLSDYSAAHTTAASVFRRSSHRQAARAATTGHIFSDRLTLLKSDSQQRAAIKAEAPTLCRQQHFSFTPSESNSLFICELVEISSSSERLIDFASAWGVQ